MLGPEELFTRAHWFSNTGFSQNTQYLYFTRYYLEYSLLYSLLFRVIVTHTRYLYGLFTGTLGVLSSTLNNHFCLPLNYCICVVLLPIPPV